MTTQALVEEKRFPRFVTGSKAPIWWAMLVLIAIESTVFATLLTSYLYLRFTAPAWPPPPIPLPDLLLPTLNTLILLGSGVAVYIASNAIRRGDARRLKIWLGIGVAMEVVFLSVKIVDMAARQEYDWTSHAYGSIVYLVDGFHTLHVVVAILMGAVAEVHALRGYFTAERRLGIQAVNLYWQFVAIVWIPVYVVLYLVPRWF